LLEDSSYLKGASPSFAIKLKLALLKKFCSSICSIWLESL
jgi:hypothetical protein